MTQPLEHVSFDNPDEVREGENWRLELVNLAGDAQVGRITVQPGWRAVVGTHQAGGGHRVVHGPAPAVSDQWPEARGHGRWHRAGDRPG